MVSKVHQKGGEKNDQLKRHTRILKALNRLGSINSQELSHDEIMVKCGEILLLHSHYSAIWMYRYTTAESKIKSLGFVYPVDAGGRKKIQFRKVPRIKGPVDIVTTVLQTRASSIEETSALPDTKVFSSTPELFKTCGAWPLFYQHHLYGVFVIYIPGGKGIESREIALLENLTSDIALELYSHDVTKQLKVERDFNTEILDTIQALMVTVTPCGKILRFNPEAEKITGYSQDEVIDKYWVDILLSPENRRSYQKLVSGLLKKNIGNINFRAELLTKDQSRRTIEWHSSIKPDINEGTVGMVLFGLDITERLIVDKAYSSAIARFENIFSTIQDPALIVDKKGTILDANHATFSASRLPRNEVIGQSVCKILHGTLSTSKGHQCQLEKLLKTGKSRILHTDLSGLHGDYLLTLSPCRDKESAEEITLIVARDTTEEDKLKAEALRAAQLASIGELAAGVAHEINNPINGILNYAQMLNDLTFDQTGQDITARIISESRRIEGIVRNLLDFSRYHVESPEPVCARTLIDDCIELVGHQMKKEEIVIETDFQKDLPPVFCNASQVKQVILNIFSNSRYALNQKYGAAGPEKKISVKSCLASRNKIPFVRLIITDYGTGIEHQHLERIYDPFFSTKPNGEGTGLGLSISYGLMRDNNGHIKIFSEPGRFTTTTLDLPIVGQDGGSR